jgi:hypothetical protein
MPLPFQSSIAGLFGYRGIPFAVRGIFRREFAHFATWGLIWGTLNVNFCGYIATRGLGASGILVSFIVAANAISNLLAVWWGSAAVRFPKRTLITIALVSVILVMFSFAITPTLPGSWIAAVFTLQVLVAWFCIAGVGTIRANVWRLNYPVSHRARILGRLLMLPVIMGSFWLFIIGAFYDGVLDLTTRPLIDASIHLDLEAGNGSATLGDRIIAERRFPSLEFLGAGQDHAYALIFPFTAVLAPLCIWTYRRIPIRKEHTRVKKQAPTPAKPPRPADPSGNWFSTGLRGLRIGLVEGYRVLDRDRPFRTYMIWQFIGGSATMMIQVPVVLILDRTFDLSYTGAAGVLAVVPHLFLLASTPFWSRYFDRTHIYRFRQNQMAMWLVSRLLLALAVWKISMPLLIASFVMAGIAQSGGTFAWQLGHMAFSKTRNDALYMGVHQTLTGVRGLTMPFIGYFLYAYIGLSVIWFSAALLAGTCVGFRFIDLQRGQNNASRPA